MIKGRSCSRSAQTPAQPLRLTPASQGGEVPPPPPPAPAALFALKLQRVCFFSPKSSALWFKIPRLKLVNARVITQTSPTLVLVMTDTGASQTQKHLESFRRTELCHYPLSPC